MYIKRTNPCICSIYLDSAHESLFHQLVGRCADLWKSNRNKNNNHCVLERNWLYFFPLSLLFLLLPFLQWDSSRIEMNHARHIEHVFEIFPHSLSLLRGN